MGVTRGDKFPFSILNAFGVLDAKAKGEARVRRLGLGSTLARKRGEKNQSHGHILSRCERKGE